MNALSFDDALKPWQSPYGLLSDYYGSGAPSGNGVLYMGHYALIKAHLGEPLNDRAIFDTYRLVKAEHNNVAYYGLIDRKPGAPEPEAHDDYTGLVFANKQAAFEVLHYGRCNNWNYNNTDPEANSLLDIIKQKARFWHRRLPGQIEHYKLANGEGLSQLEWALWTASIVATALFSSGTSGMLMDLLKIKLADRQGHDNVYTQTAKAAFNWRLNKSFSGQVQMLYAEYFSMQHPFAQYSAGMQVK